MSDNCQLVVFSNKAYNAIIRESFDKDPVETGGILLGHVLDNGVWIVMEVLPPGINSIFQYAYFEYDEAFVNYLAQSVANQYKRPLDLLGLWHRHPGSMDVFSSTDDGTNATFARQNPAGVISGLVNIDPKFRLTMYHMDMPTHRIMGRPAYDVVDIEVGDDIIPEEYFELRYFDGEGADLHPMVSSRGSERQMNRTIRDTQRAADDSPEDQANNVNPEGLDIQGIINQGLPPCNSQQNVTPKPINDFFSFWRASNKKWMYVLIAVIALIACVCSFRSCSNAIEGIFSWTSEKPAKEVSNEVEEKKPSLSMESITFKAKGESQTIEIIDSKKTSYWKSSNPSVATVENGKVTAVANGHAVIVATIDGKEVGRCNVDVLITPSESLEHKNPKQTESQDIDNSSDKMITDAANALIDRSRTYNNGNTGTIKIGAPFVIPIVKTGNPTISFRSSKPEIASIDNKGSVTAKKKGTTEIVVLCNGKESDKFTLNVTEK